MGFIERRQDDDEIDPVNEKDIGREFEISTVAEEENKNNKI